MNLEEHRKKYNLTYEQLAYKIGISKRGLQKIIKTRSSSLTVLTAYKIKQATRLNPQDYIDGLEAFKKLLK